MRQPARPEVVAERSRDAVVLAEHDPGQDRAPFSRRPAGERLFDVRVQPVGDATDPAPPADEACVVAAQHDVDALPRQPRTLVEAGLGPARRDRLCAQLENCPLRGCALARQLEQDALALRSGFGSLFGEALADGLHLAKRLFFLCEVLVQQPRNLVLLHCLGHRDEPFVGGDLVVLCAGAGAC